MGGYQQFLKSEKADPVFPQANWHALTREQVFGVINSSPFGLNHNEVSYRIKAFRRNEVTVHKKNRAWKIFFRQFKSPLIYILIIAGFISIFPWIGEYLEGL